MTVFYTCFLADTWGAFVEKRKKKRKLYVSSCLVRNTHLCCSETDSLQIVRKTSCYYVAILLSELISAQSEGKWAPELLTASRRTEIRTLQHSRQSVSELKEVDTCCGWILIRAAHTPSNSERNTTLVMRVKCTWIQYWKG